MRLAILIAGVVFGPMIVEATVSARNERVLRRLGAREPAGDVYRVMVFGYPAAFACVVAEGWVRQITFDAVSASGLAVFVAAKGLKYWAIRTLGTRWTFRVLVPPNSRPTRSGPYRFARHPNYLAVAGELVGATVMAHAWLTGPIATAAFTWLMVRRIRIEERALADVSS